MIYCLYLAPNLWIPQTHVYIYVEEFAVNSLLLISMSLFSLFFLSDFFLIFFN